MNIEMLGNAAAANPWVAIGGKAVSSGLSVWEAYKQAENIREARKAAEEEAARQAELASIRGQQAAIVGFGQAKTAKEIGKYAAIAGGAVLAGLLLTQ